MWNKLREMARESLKYLDIVWTVIIQLVCFMCD